MITNSDSDSWGRQHGPVVRDPGALQGSGTPGIPCRSQVLTLESEYHGFLVIRDVNLDTRRRSVVLSGETQRLARHHFSRPRPAVPAWREGAIAQRKKVEAAPRPLAGMVPADPRDPRLLAYRHLPLYRRDAGDRREEVRVPQAWQVDGHLRVMPIHAMFLLCIRRQGLPGAAFRLSQQRVQRLPIQVASAKHHT